MLCCVYVYTCIYSAMSLQLLAGAANGSGGQGAMGEGCGVVCQSVMLLLTSKLIQGSICIDLVRFGVIIQ